MNDNSLIENRVRRWIEKAVIGLNLCPFAKSVYMKDQVRITICEAQNTQALTGALYDELRLLEATPAQQTDTTLLVIPNMFEQFSDFNDYLDIADAVLDELELVGEIQLASFHPLYQFADTEPDDVDNYTNRAPYPILHLLREDSLDKAAAQYPDASVIFERNIAVVRELGHDGWCRLLRDEQK
ncbi:hypothetical protein CAP48_10180 [Advenella sp. S44]|uniref:DUF1415 domain-containing protein n=1 Tax=Advenella sp. S44 TaxID=1982755 RepID=UPI000C2A9C57|nr:DUF1415 domain-containing protein [Advenella sp. S44]PJX26349.1 hypothetical protein CAP48_10180 [Advenella sp. S44]